MRTYTLPDGVELKFHSFCDNCSDLTVCQNSVRLIGDDATIMGSHTISCENYEKCKKMYERIKNK